MREVGMFLNSWDDTICGLYLADISSWAFVLFLSKGCYLNIHKVDSVQK